VHTANTSKDKPSISIVFPVPQSTLDYGNSKVEVEVSAVNGVEMVEFYVDDDKRFFSNKAPYSGFVNISRFMKTGSTHLIIAKVIDKLGYSSQSAIEFKVVPQEAPPVE